MSNTRLRLLTLNCWGLKYVSSHRAERIAAIANALAASDYDVITLQELWVFADYEHVRATVHEKLPYAKFFYSGALGAGLVIFSRFPILAATIHPYSLNGSPIDVIAGDWFVGKAAASILFMHPVLGQVQLFDTHLFAKGGDQGPDHHKAHRLVNAWEFAKLARQAADLGRYVIAAGDFNSIPGTLPMSIIADHAGLTDAWAATHPYASPASAGPPSPMDAIRTYGVTADSPLNSYSAGKPLEPVARKHQGKRLDYVFFRQPSGASDRAPVLKCVDTRVVFTETVPGRSFSYSDHFGLEATFDISLPGGTDSSNAPVPAPLTLRSSLSAVSVTAALQSLTARYRFAHAQGRFHLTIFAVCLLLLLALVVGSAWLPRFWSPLLVFASIFFSWLATTMLYIGFVYGRWEINALTNIIEELEIYRTSLEDSRQNGQT
ncbi:Inositol phosphosphingolipids phospholipase C [Grifola frondosa]|uniref:Inositol phosphosphingolipids phospholipase C n=1 Tax=Grifola frondosa TaxID=5627 RepID=A0A1C7MQB0_GRIFR|nr:Inositol phosphosphingolipids phospholipase C [Grifola frondosa]